MSKLYVPAPDEEPAEVFGILELAALICTLLAVTIFYGFATQKSTSERADASAEEEAVQELSAEVRRQKQVAAGFDERKPSELEDYAWKTEELLAVIRYGERETAEAACQARSGQIREGALSDPTLMTFIKAMDRRAENAPWACLLRLYFADEIGQDELVDEMDSFWQEVEAHEGNARIIASALEEFRKTRDRPEADRFYEWLRLCALDFEYQAAAECQRLLHQLSPAQGADILMAAEKHLQESKPSGDDLKMIVDAIGQMARNGQPHATWSIKETANLPDYDVDFRQAAVLYLCRFVQSPDKDLARVAAFELGKTALFGARGFDDKLRRRWIKTCQLAFQKSDAANDPALQILAVWDGNEASEPEYALAQDVERGVCEVQEDYPMWYCGTRLWNGEGKALDMALQDFFVETRYIETEDWPD